MLLRAAAMIAPPRVEVVLYTELGTIPPYNPDFDIEPVLEPIARLRAALRDASAVIFSTPEYAHGIPGALKNALDWVVASGELSAKPVALLNASSRGAHARAALQEVLRTMDARLVSQAEITIPLLGQSLDSSEIVANDEFAELLLAAVTTIAAAASTVP